MRELSAFIVEDSQVIRDNLIATLQDLVPVRVVGTSEDEASAVAWLGGAGNEADLVIIDIVLKSGSGLGILRSTQLKRKGRKAVILSNYATLDVRRKCLDLGADRVFDKSNEIDTLIEYCRDLAAGDTSAAALA